MLLQNLHRCYLYIVIRFTIFYMARNSHWKQIRTPLISIYKKHMVDISPRVQRLIVRSFLYLPFHVVYKKGKDIPVADALSRVTPMDPEDNIQLPIIAVNMITTCILMSTSSGYFFQEVRLTEEEYSARRSTHKNKPLHQHRIPL